MPPLTPDDIGIFAVVAAIAILVATAVLVVLRAMNEWHPLGTGDLWPLRWSRLRSVRVGDVLRQLWTIALWVLAVVLVFYAVVGVAPAIALVVVAILVSQRYRMARQRAMLSTLAVAAERGIPLPPVLRALVAGRHGPVAARTRQAAAYLESGATLPDALAAPGKLAPRRALFKLRLGQEMGALPQALREAGQTEVAAESARAQLAGKLIYLAVVVLFAFQVVFFVAWKIIPSYEKIFKDFGTRLPPVTRSVIALDHIMLDFWPLVILPVFFLLLYVLAWALAGFEANFPVLRRLAARLDRAAIFESLALVTGRQRPLSEGVVALAMHYPKGWVRRRLNRVFTAVHAGANWIDSLLAQRLIGPADAAVLHAAERAGNLPWALRELAESNRRRFTYRLSVLLQVLFPAAILLFGSMVGIFVAACFTPLIALIQRMVG